MFGKTGTWEFEEGVPKVFKESSTLCTCKSAHFTHTIMHTTMQVRMQARMFWSMSRGILDMFWPH